MAISTLGNKFICFMCQCKFYDLNRPDPVCPRCKVNQKDQPKVKASGGRSRAAAKEKVKVKVKEKEVYHPPDEEVAEDLSGEPPPGAGSALDKEKDEDEEESEEED